MRNRVLQVAVIGFLLGIMVVVWGQTLKNSSRYHALAPNGFLVTGRTTAIAATTIYNTGVATPTGDSTIRVSLNVTCTVQTAASTATPSFTWTDTSGTAQSATLTAANCATLGSASWIHQTAVVRIRGNTNVQGAVAISGTPTYDASLLVEQIN